MNKKVVSKVIVISLFIAFTLLISIEWLYENLGGLSIDEIIFHMKVPMKGTNTDLVWKYLIECPWKIIAATALVAGILIYPMKKNTSEKTKNIVIRILDSNINISRKYGAVSICYRYYRIYI